MGSAAAAARWRAAMWGQMLGKCWGGVEVVLRWCWKAFLGGSGAARLFILRGAPGAARREFGWAGTGCGGRWGTQRAGSPLLWARCMAGGGYRVGT